MDILIVPLLILLKSIFSLLVFVVVDVLLGGIPHHQGVVEDLLKAADPGREGEQAHCGVSAGQDNVGVPV